MAALLQVIGTVEQGNQSIITITQGDTATFELTCVAGDSKTPVNLTGATLTTQIKKNDGTVTTFPNSQHTPNADQVGHTGQFTLALATSDTATLMIGIREVITKAVIGGVTTEFHGINILNVLQGTPIS